jgi:hypothetical protein
MTMMVHLKSGLCRFPSNFHVVFMPNDGGDDDLERAAVKSTLVASWALPLVAVIIVISPIDLLATALDVVS